MIGQIHSSTRRHMDASIKAQYDFEGSLVSRTGANNGTLVGSVIYSNAFSSGFYGGKNSALFQNPSNGIGLATSLFRASGTVEFIYKYENTASAANVLYQVSSNGANRHSELYVFLGTLYYFSNWPTASYNTPMTTILPNKNYYIGITWGTGVLNVHMSLLPEYPSSAPIGTFSSPRFENYTVSSAYMPAQVIQGSDASKMYYDKISVSNVFRTRFPNI